MAVKEQKELAFLRDLTVESEWTQRFADLVDKYLDLSEAENMLYINAGTGGHALSIYERFGEKTFFATIGEAVSVYRVTYPVEWVDWEDRTT